MRDNFGNIVNLTTCMTCNKVCNPQELDEYYECFACQGFFVKNLDYKPWQTNLGNHDYLDQIPEEIRHKIIKEANDKIGYYEKPFKNIENFCYYANEKFELDKYGVRLTKANFHAFRVKYQNDNPEFEFSNKRLRVKPKKSCN